ncbi:MAG: hypothetical protein IK091_09855 [Spirochaetales bacterium]|nr:hypothetical protein [Spirochaetales bacterium]
MRKFLIILLSILLLLVSCATKEVKQDGPEIDVIEATVVETPAPVVPEPEPEPVVPQEEPVPEPEPEPEPESEPQPVVEPVVEQEVIIVPVVVEEPAVEQPSEEDWSMVITASAPVEETTEEPETKEATETKPAEEKAPASAQTTAKAEEASKPAANPSFVDKITDVFKKIGQFIMKEKLMSIGFLTCIIGVIYLIVALIKTRRPRDRYDSYYAYQDKNYEEQEPEVEQSKPEPKKQDTEPENEDDEFLRSLLGDDRD